MYLQTVLRSGLHLGPLVLWWWSVSFCIRDREVFCSYTSCGFGAIQMFVFCFVLFFLGLDSGWQNRDCTNIYTHNFHDHIHHHCCCADVEKERTSNPRCEQNKTRFKTSDVSNVSLSCSLFEWLHPVCGFIFIFLSRSLH